MFIERVIGLDDAFNTFHLDDNCSLCHCSIVLHPSPVIGCLLHPASALRRCFFLMTALQQEVFDIPATFSIGLVALTDSRLSLHSKSPR